MGKKLLIVGAVLALSGGVGLFSRTEQKRTSWMDRMGKTGNTIGASFALLFGHRLSHRRRCPYLARCLIP